ncbi:MAG: hypothetical protein HY870_22170 [Chloroflexi bacterium]|nr:hypothetical protein [Chloroflexota bacterium]
MSDQAVKRAQDVKRRHEAQLLRKPNVVAVGVGFRTRGGQPTQEVCIVVSVKTKVPAAQLKRGDLLPASIDGVPIDVVETGAIRAR